MSSKEDKKDKKRRREQHTDRNAAPAKRWSPFGALSPSLATPIFDDRDPDSIMTLEDNSDQKSRTKLKRRPERVPFLLDLPVELLWTILRLLDSETASQPEKSILRHGIRDYAEIHRRDLYHVRATCTFLKDITLSPYLWASHLLLRSGSISLPSLSSISPFGHTHLSLRCVTTLTMVLEDSLSDLRQHRENLLDLIGNSKIRSLILVRPSKASETFVRSSVVAEMTPTEQLLRFLMDETALLLGMRRLTLINVVVRPALLQSLHAACGNLVQLSMYWASVTLPPMASRKFKPSLGESFLLSVPTSSGSPPSKERFIQNQARFDSSRVFLSRESQLLMDFVPPAPMHLSRLHLSGPGAVMVSPPFISSSLRKFHLDFTALDDLPFWERLQATVRALPATCPLLASFSLYLGKLNSKVCLDIGDVFHQLPSTHLEAMASDVAVSFETLPQLTEAIARCPNLRTLDLRFSTTGSSASTVPTAAPPATQSIWNPLFTAPTSQPTFGGRANVLLPTATVTVGSQFLPQNSNFGSLATLFGARSSSATSAHTTASRAAPVVPSILNALSQHCKSLRRLRLTKEAGKPIAEPWSGLRFPCLLSLRYNLGQVPAAAFEAMEVAFPQLVQLDLSRAEMADPSQSLAGLEGANALQALRLEGTNADPRSLLPLLESRKASSSIAKLDLRVSHPYGIDDLLLRRIGSSCGASLTHLAFSVAPSTPFSPSTIPHQSFTLLLQQCKRLKSIRTTENSTIPTATADLIRQSGVELLRS